MSIYKIKALEFMKVGDDFHIDNRLFKAYILKDTATGWYSLWYGEHLAYDGLSLDNAVEIVTEHYRSILSDFLTEVRE